MLWVLVAVGAFALGAQAAGPNLDLSQPPDPQPPGGPTGNGEDWEGDGRAPVTDDSSDESTATSTDQNGKGSDRSGSVRGVKPSNKPKSAAEP